ncbi:MAG: hypothetical protein DI598_18610 [Pseudopedobacter saltans]|uniref:Uncharacterized protein n=1 Tax=Pseudopedobacter saltans TaxID=151895 RepID=A0A2W5EGC3_9SPHI|nr:MAG: hypothetical protein DI598_18610 [Pseudopedobacter saltans]
MGEGCVTTTWIQFNMQMFSLTGDMKFYNEIEKSYYNHLLGAENPITGCVSYYTPLIGEKPYACHITCCLSSVPRGIALGPYLNYGKLDCSPTILLYESASIMDSVKTNNGKMINLNLKMDSKFPHEGYAKIKVGLSSSASFALQLRNPVWCKRFRIKINGQAHPINSHNQLSVVERKWKSGDIVEVFFDIPILRVDGKSSYTGYFALKRGPQMLALDYSLNRNIDLKNAKWSLTKMEDYKVVNHKKNLPSQWIGNQLYNISLQDSNGTSQQLALVPYADASQTGGFTDLWIKGISTK